MPTKRFRHLVRLIALPSMQVFLTRFWGALLGLLHVGWILLFVLLVDLLLWDGRVVVEDHATAEQLQRLLGREFHPGQVPLLDNGILPAVVHTRGRWSQPVFEWIYVHFGWTRRNLSYLSGLLVIALGMGLIRVGLMVGQSVAALKAVGAGVHRLQQNLFLHKVAPGTQTARPDHGANLSSLLREDMPLVERGLHAWLETTPREPVRLLALLGVTLALNLWLGATFLLLAVLVWIVGSAILQRATRRRRELAARADAQLQRIRALADKNRLIKGYAADAYFQEHYSVHLQRHHHDVMRRKRYEARVVPVWNLLGMLLVLAIVGLAAQNVLTDKFGIAGAAGVLACLVGVGVSLNQWFSKRRAILEAEPAAAHIQSFLDENARSVVADGPLFLTSLDEGIDFEHVSYRDAPGRNLLEEVNCSIPAHRRTALLATEPAEAHAMVDLLNRFTEPSRGAVKFDGQDLRASTLESLRAQVCLVLQSDLLFPDTVANNIGCGDPGFDRDRIIEAAKVAHAHALIEKLPHGYDCIIGEQGFPLKIGEQYRIALARAILRDPPVVVLEEPAGPLDPDSEALLDDTLTRFLHGRTALLLPSRLATLKACEYILILDKGRIAAQGAHNDLFTSNALYRFLHLTRFSDAGARSA